MDYKEQIGRLIFLSKCEKRTEYNDMNVGKELESAATAIAELLDRVERAEKELEWNGWISAEDSLPKNEQHPGAFSPKYRVLTKYGETYGWYNPDFGGWFILVWCMTARFLEEDIDFERGDVPRVVWVRDRNIVTHWQPKSQEKEKMEDDL